MEILRQKCVRLIAVNDGVDSLKGDDDFTPFRNIFNEFYARDTSRKIRSSVKAKGMSGKHTASQAPYGYLKSPEDKNVWIVDDEAAAVVRQIFNLTMEGFGPYQISQLLAQQKIEIPAVHLARHGDALQDTAPYQRQRGIDLDCRYAESNRGLFQERPGRVYQDRAGDASVTAGYRHHQEKTAACSGKQKEYEGRIKTEKRRQMEAKKAALRAEDMAKGVFYIAGSVPQQELQKGTLPPRASAI